MRWKIDLAHPYVGEFAANDFSGTILYGTSPGNRRLDPPGASAASAFAG